MENGKKNNSLIIVIIVIAIVVAVTVGIFLNRDKDSDDAGANSGNKSALQANQIDNIEESDGSLPTFTLTITGTHSGEITDTNIKNMNLKIYEFDAGIDNGWTTVTSHFVGVKVSDLLNASKITTYKELKFEASNDKSITYARDKVTDQTYIVFKKDGENVDTTQSVMLLSVDKDYDYSLNKLINIYVPFDYDND